MMTPHLHLHVGKVCDKSHHSRSMTYRNDRTRPDCENCFLVPECFVEVVLFIFSCSYVYQLSVVIMLNSHKYFVIFAKYRALLLFVIYYYQFI